MDPLESEIARIQAMGGVEAALKAGEITFACETCNADVHFDDVTIVEERSDGRLAFHFFCPKDAPQPSS